MNPYSIALKEWGNKTTAGFFHSPEVLKYFSEIGAGWVKDDETAWCAAFVNWCLKQSGNKYSAKLNARSFLTYGTPTKVPQLGDIVVLWRITKDGPYGHVGFFVKRVNEIIYILGGNQSSTVNITGFSAKQLLEYRKI
jgi:uncharacterized protein (TIGR02594 family)